MKTHKSIKYSSLIFCSLITITLTFSTHSSAFEVYSFLPYPPTPSSDQQSKSFSSTVLQSNPSLKKIKIIYENELLSTPQADNSPASRINKVKIQNAALKYKNLGVKFFSLDIESWNRFDPKTPSLYLQTLKIFKEAYPEATVGLYSIVPQNTYLWTENKLSSYDEINARYVDVAKTVDYFSPSLYNYSGDDFSSWVKSAKYNINAARNYDPYKKILPYITPEVQQSGAIRLLTYEEMKARLEVLSQLGVDGCILWGSSRSRISDGSRPTLDPQAGWLKAVIEFSNSKS